LLTGGGGGFPFGGIQCNTQPGGRGGAAIACSSLDDIAIAGASTLNAGFTPTPRCSNIQPTPAVVGTGTLTTDPAVRLVPGSGAPPVDPRMAYTQRRVSALFANQTIVSLRNFASWTHADPPGTFVFTFISAGAYPVVPHPVVFGGIHVNIGLAIITGPLVMGNTGSLSVGFTVPDDASLRGKRVYVQTVGVDTRLQATASSPSALYVRF
jgi:hypothetical protein